MNTTANNHITAHLRDITQANAERDRLHAAGAAQRHFDEAARNLPDELFNGDPEIARLTQDAKAKADRCQRLKFGTNRRDGVAGAMNLMRAQLSEAQAEMRLAAIDDALDGDHTFKRAAAVALRVHELRRQLDAAMLAQEALALSPPELIEFSEAATVAQSAMRSALLARKREHVRAHPELLHAPAQAGA